MFILTILLVGLFCLRFQPLIHIYELGVEAQVDWYEAVAEIDGVRQTVQVFALRSMASGAAFHRAYLRGTQQAFLEAHQLAFDYFGGGNASVTG